MSYSIELDILQSLIPLSDWTAVLPYIVYFLDFPALNVYNTVDILWLLAGNKYGYQEK